MLLRASAQLGASQPRSHPPNSFGYTETRPQAPQRRTFSTGWPIRESKNTLCRWHNCAERKQNDTRIHRVSLGSFQQWSSCYREEGRKQTIKPTHQNIPLPIDRKKKDGNDFIGLLFQICQDKVIFLRISPLSARSILLTQTPYFPSASVKSKFYKWGYHSGLKKD